MAEYRVLPGPLRGCESLKNAVCVSTGQIYDACKDKDCAEDLRCYLTGCGQAALDRAVSVRPRSAQVLCCNIDVEPVPFNEGYYTVDAKFFIKCVCDAYCTCGDPQRIEGLCSFAKRVILFGSCGSAKVFSSEYRYDDPDRQLRATGNQPRAVCETVDPIMLDAKTVDASCLCGCGELDVAALPEGLCRCFDGGLTDPAGGRRLFVTLGLFSIIRLERDSKLLIPAYDFYIPEKECSCDEEEPCGLFRRIDFPTEQFAPPFRAPLDTGCPCAERRRR